ncbi:hypothetical protein CLS_07940 [[Clostridium] cf. saccharolyticum K10]|nr:hypothetical protein CLS_07940 [[Clostridium] cf. saccharolyticum K10]
MLRYAETARRCKSLKNLEISRKTSKIKEFRIDDKNFIYLPRQVTKIVLKALEKQGFFQNPT